MMPRAGPSGVAYYPLFGEVGRSSRSHRGQFQAVAVRRPGQAGSAVALNVGSGHTKEASSFVSIDAICPSPGAFLSPHRQAPPGPKARSLTTPLLSGSAKTSCQSVVR